MKGLGPAVKNKGRLDMGSAVTFYLTGKSQRVHNRGGGGGIILGTFPKRKDLQGGRKKKGAKQAHLILLGRTGPEGKSNSFSPGEGRKRDERWLS